VSNNNIEPVDDFEPSRPGPPGHGASAKKPPALRPRRRFPTQVLVLLLIVWRQRRPALYAHGAATGMRSGFKFRHGGRGLQGRRLPEGQDLRADHGRPGQRAEAPRCGSGGLRARGPFHARKLNEDYPGTSHSCPSPQSDDERHKQEASARGQGPCTSTASSENIARIDEQKPPGWATNRLPTS